MEATKKAPPPPPPGRPPARPAPAQSLSAPARPLGVVSGVTQKVHKVVIYGPGGVGKTELWSLLKQVGVRPLCFDLDNETGYLDVDRVVPETWDELRNALHDESLCAPYDAIVIESLTRAEELAKVWTLANVRHEKGNPITSIESYGFGKGYTHVYETFLQLLGDLDSHARRGRHIICTAHDCTAKVPNPSGEDWIEYEPRLQNSDRSSIRHRVKEWAGHLLFVNFDTFVNEDGKGKGSGTRTIYTFQTPAWWAKSRSLPEPIPYEQGNPELWKQLLGKE